jgi:tripartite-type tricarboxylate transporter receptor subunit TctC
MSTIRSAAALALCLILGLILATYAAPSSAQNYPSRPIRIVNPFSPGGSSDALARTIGQHLQERLGQPVLVESRTGAGGVIGADAVAKSPADGYTLLAGTSFLPLAVHTHKTLPFDLLTDLAPVTLIGGTAMLLVAHPGVPARSMVELIALAKSKPGELTYASPGTGTPNHLAMELLNEQAGISMRHVPYRSNPLAMNDVIAGHVPLLLDFVSTGAPHVRSGAVRALASTGPSRAKVLPDVPTMMEAGVANFQTRAWFGLFVPGGTPKDIISKLHTEIAAVLAMAAVQERLDALGVELTVGGPDQLAELVKTDLATWGPVVAKSGIAKE